MFLGRSVRHARYAARRLASGRKSTLSSTVHTVDAWRQQQRFFAGKGDDFMDDEEDVEPRMTPPMKSLTADEMEFFDELDFDDFVEEEEDDKEWDEEQEKRKQMLDELDQRKGRGWSDPWEITDENWMQRRVLEDLPDWTPALCSRISVERVKVHPGEYVLLLIVGGGYSAICLTSFYCAKLANLFLIFVSFGRWHTNIDNACKASVATSTSSSSGSWRHQGLWQAAQKVY